MKSKRTKTLRICCIAIAFIFTFTHFSFGGLYNRQWQQNTDSEDAQVNNTQDAKVVTTSNTDNLITNGFETLLGPLFAESGSQY